MADLLNPFEVSQHYWSLPFEQRRYRRVAELLSPKLSGAELTKLESQVGKLVRQWDHDKKVLHLVLPEPSNVHYLPMLPDLEDQLRRRFGLRDVVVVDTTRLELPAADVRDDAKAWHQHNDRVHQHLGIWAGRIATTLIRPGDVVGAAGGRAMYYTAANCNIPPSSAYYPKRVVSLTADITAHMWQKDHVGMGVLPASLDADYIASLLKSALSTKTAPRFLNCPITAQRKQFNVSDVTIALIGIGALAGEHRMLRFEGFSELDAVQSDLAELRNLVTKHDPPLEGKGPFHHWVGDVCNFLFVVDQSPGSECRLPKDVADKLTRVVDRLNKRFVNTKPPMLVDICRKGVVLAVAGGRHKVQAIAHVVKQNPPWITHLVTDDHVAQHLLKMT
jgi:DNA-binding transcriptional regulator LsrR (DeoR family)